MAKEFAKAFYQSQRWKACRAGYIAERMGIDGGMCERCHKVPGYIVHHKIVLTKNNINNPDVTLNTDRFEFLCKQCHDEVEEHAFIKIKKLLCEFDSDGQPIPPLESF